MDFNRFHTLALRAKFSLRELLSSSAVGVQCLSYFGQWSAGLVDKESVICIEGYPRSANTYSVAAFMLSQNLGQSDHIGRHTHMAGQLKRARHFGVPTLVVVRAPLDAIASFKVFAPHLTLKQCISSYYQFHRVVLEMIDDVVLAQFEDVTEDFGKVLCKLKESGRTETKLLENKEGFAERCFDLVERLDNRPKEQLDNSATAEARPNDRRRTLSRELKSQLKEESYRDLMEKCEDLYQQLRIYS